MCEKLYQNSPFKGYILRQELLKYVERFFDTFEPQDKDAFGKGVLLFLLFVKFW